MTLLKTPVQLNQMIYLKLNMCQNIAHCFVILTDRILPIWKVITSVTVLTLSVMKKKCHFRCCFLDAVTMSTHFLV